MSAFAALKGANPKSGALPLIEPGKYLFAITNWEELSNNEGWRGIRFEFTCQAGKYKDRKVWHTFTTALPSKPEIARENLDKMAGLLVAFGVPDPGNVDPARIKGLRGGLKITKGKNKKTGDDENRVVDWMPATAVPAENLSGAPAARPHPGGVFAPFQPATPPAGSLYAPMTTAQTAQTELNDEIPF